MKRLLVFVILVAVAALLWKLFGPRITPQDEAKRAGKTAADFPEITTDVFKLMDGGIALSPDEIKGRNTWILWTAGNENFWDTVARDSFGLMDLLKMLDSRKRETRFKELGVINEPGFRKAARQDEFGLWLDERVEAEPPGIDPEVYGKSSGVIGFRLFPNPAFDEKARKKWDAKRFYEDPGYYNDNSLVRPYRVGVACGSCHVAPHPLFPPDDPENPRWENLASAIGNQYIREGKVFAGNVAKGGFFAQMLAAQPPGTSDTSRIATDHINNPNAINAIFELAERERIGAEEEMAGGTLSIPGEKKKMRVPHILKDGADSVGVPGATIRVFVNIGMFSEYWLERHNRLLGLKPQGPFLVPEAQKKSVFWRATEAKLANIRAFFLRIKPMRLADAPGGAEKITKDQAILDRGKIVFAESCAGCHSSKQPDPPLEPGSEAAKAWFRQAVMQPDFLEANFLSNERRYPVTEIKTNSSRAVATNAMRGHVWDNFSSETYKQLKSPGTIEAYNPWNPGEPLRFTPPDGGPGYYRPPSLVAIWTSAPFLHNNALGSFNGDPSVEGRLAAFQDASEKLLWPEKRLGVGSIWRTQEESALSLRKEFVPWFLRWKADRDGYLRLGPVPKGMPVNLLGNLDPQGPGEMFSVATRLGKALVQVKSRGLEGDAATDELRKAVPALLEANACPDFVEDRGHEFGAQLSDEDKRALIEFMKTF
jgi:cytochrome c5